MIKNICSLSPLQEGILFHSLTRKEGTYPYFENPRIETLDKLIEKSVKVEFQHIKKLPKSKFYDVSNSQKRLWILDKLQKSPLYNVIGIYEIRGDLNINALEKLFNYLII